MFLSGNSSRPSTDIELPRTVMGWSELTQLLKQVKPSDISGMNDEIGGPEHGNRFWPQQTVLDGFVFRARVARFNIQSIRRP